VVVVQEKFMFLST